MPSFYNYNPEKKDSSFIDLYLMAGFVGFILVFLLIASGYGISFLVSFVIKYYLWVLGVLGAIVVVRHFWNRGNKRDEIKRDEICESY